MKTLVIGVAGPSGGGKTTFVEIISCLADLLWDNKVLVISTDDYYRDLSTISFKQRGKQNFDHPRAIDLELFYQNLCQLLEGEAIEEPIYDFVEHRVKGTKRIDPKDYDLIILEGILLFHDQRILEKLGDNTAYVEVNQPICFLRRFRRDLFSRGRKPLSIVLQYLLTVYPGYKKFVKPTSTKAKIRVIGGGYDPIGILKMLRLIKNSLRSRKE